MPLLPLKLGSGVNLDTDATTVGDGTLVSLYNAYKDRGDAIRTMPGVMEYVTVDASVTPDRRVWHYYSHLQDVLIIVCNGRVYKQAELDGDLTEITGATLDTAVIPTFTEDKDYIYLAANSAIYRINGTVAEVLGAITVNLEIVLTAATTSATSRTIALSCTGSTSVYYTIDGTPPDKTKTRYTAPVLITDSQTLKAIAYDDDDNEAPIVTSDDFSCAFVVDGEHPNPRLVTIRADKAASVYYTVDGSTPSSAKTLYTPGTQIAVNTTLTLKAIAYDGNGSASEIISADYSVDTTGDTTKPVLKKFTVGAVDKNSVTIKEFTGTDKVGVTGYCITESVTPPALNDEKWSKDPIKTYTSRTATAGTRDIYPWLRDAAGNISNAASPESVAFLAADTQPDPINFTPQVDVERSRYIESDAIQPSGYTFETTFTISGGEYAISTNGGYEWTNWRTATGTIKPGYAIKVRHQSSAYGNTSTTTTLTIGTNTATFTTTTKADQLPRYVKRLAYLGGYVLAIGQPAVGDAVAGDVMFSDDFVNNYSKWEVYNNESQPDALQSFIVAYEQVYNIGTRTTEVAIIDGVTPFAVNKNAFQHFGTMAENSPAFDGENIYFLTEVAKRRAIVKLAGGSAPKIISLPVDIPLEQMDSVADAVGYVLAFRGQNFYCLDFPSSVVTIDGQTWNGITLAYHLQKDEWVIFGQYDSTESVYKPFRGCSFTYIEPWGLELIGGRDGKLYKLYENETLDYTEEPVLTHRWRDDHRETWCLPRTIALSAIGDYRLPPDQYQCGLYQERQHEFVYSDPILDAGEQFRAVIRTGWGNQGSDNKKRVAFYRYNVKRGKNELVINSISESVDFLRR